MKYKIIYYSDQNQAMVETWELPLLEVIKRCKMIFIDGGYTHAEVIQDTPRYIIKNEPIEYEL